MQWLLNGMLDNEGGPLAHCVSGSALLQASIGKLWEPPPPAAAMTFATPDDVDANDPAAAGWIVIVPDDQEGELIARKLAPLIEHRMRGAHGGGVRHPLTGCVKRLPSAQSAPGELASWVEREIAFSAELDSFPPEYVLIAGPPTKLPFELDHLLRLRHQRAGRLAFRDLQGYADYAQKVIKWEPENDFALSPRTSSPIGVFATDLGPRDATRLSRMQLIDPLRDWLRKQERPVVDCIGEAASRAALLRLLGEGGPGLLFSATHGLAVCGEGKREARLRRQGAITCQNAVLLGEEEILTADALGDGAALRGGIWMMFACFGAGTPQQNEFLQTLVDKTLLALYDGGPFMAELPSRLLANPDGPLAVLGHLDPSFTHAIADPSAKGGRRSSALLSVVIRLLRGSRVGGCIGELSSDANLFSQQIIQVKEDIARTIKSAADEEIAAALSAAEPGTQLASIRNQLVDMTVSYYEFRNFVLLGDPAVKLPRQDAQPRRMSSAPAPAVAAAAPAASAGLGSLHAVIVAAQRNNCLVFSSLEEIFSPVGVALPPGDSAVIALVAQPCADVRSRPAPAEPLPDGRKLQYYEAVEHQDCDLLVTIRLSAQAAWPAPAYRLPIANGVRLRYGELISLFGDFYGIPGRQVAQGESAFLDIFGTLESGKKEELVGILAAVNKERAAVEEAQGAGTSVTDAYRRVGDELNGAYNGATGGGSFIHPLLPLGRYLKLASVNYDHFGSDALSAYRVAHGVACAAARRARTGATPQEREQGLIRAYAMNACADHFLTDLFASGHLRVPRRALSSQIAVKLIGDLLAKRMHDEDNSHGLKVRNRQQREWTAYGDQFFHDEPNAVGRRIAREAVRASAAEVWAAFSADTAPAFAALDMVPDLDDALSREDNPAALFIVQDGVLKRRKVLEDRHCREWTTDYTGIGTLLRGAIDDRAAKHRHGDK